MFKSKSNAKYIRAVVTFLLLGSFSATCFAVTENFGYESVGGTATDFVANWGQCIDYTAPANAVTVDSFTMNIDTMGTSGVKPVLWLASDGSVVAVGPAITVGTGWQTSVLSSPVAITGGTVYCLGAVFSDTNTLFVYDNDSVTNNVDTGNNFGTPISFEDDASDDNRMSIYATATIGEEEATSTASTTTTTTDTTNETLYHGFILFFLTFGFVVWNFRRRK